MLTTDHVFVPDRMKQFIISYVIDEFDELSCAPVSSESYRVRVRGDDQYPLYVSFSLRHIIRRQGRLRVHEDSTMSFFTSLKFYRPTKPTSLTTDELEAFILGFRKMAVAEEAREMPLNAAFGTMLDVEEKHPIGNAAVKGNDSTSTDWDLEKQCDSYESPSKITSLASQAYSACVCGAW